MMNKIMKISYFVALLGLVFIGPLVVSAGSYGGFDYPEASVYESYDYGYDYYDYPSYDSYDYGYDYYDYPSYDSYDYGYDYYDYPSYDSYDYGYDYYDYPSYDYYDYSYDEYEYSYDYYDDYYVEDYYIPDYGGYYPTYSYYDNYYIPSYGGCTSCGREIAYDAPLRVSCYPSDSFVEVGESVTWTAVAHGGDGDYDYDWSGTDGLDGDGRTESITYDDAGTKHATVVVRSNGDSRSANCGIVSVDEEDNGSDDLDVVCRVSDENIEAGDEVTFTADVDGGDSPFEYNWSGDIDGNNRIETETFDDEGDYEVRITVTDDDGDTASDTCPIINVEEEDDDEDFDVVCEVSDTSIDEGDEVTYTARVTGGNSPFEYEWRGDIDGDNRSEDVTYDDRGTYEVSVRVEDDDGNTVSDTCPDVRVNDDDNDDEDFELTCRVDKTYANIGETVRWSVDVDGGNSPFDYDWSGTDGLNGSNSSVSKSYSSGGTKRATIEVEDDDGERIELDCPSIFIGSGVSFYSGPTSGYLSSVYLSQLPQTGLEDDIGLYSFIALLVAWAVFATRFILKRSNRFLKKKNISEFKRRNWEKKVGIA